MGRQEDPSWIPTAASPRRQAESARRVTLTLALAVFALGHTLVALTESFTVLLAARLLSARATGAFWAVAAVVATRLAGPTASSRALGIVLGGGMLANVI